MSEPLTCVSVSGTNFDVPRSLLSHLKRLPWSVQTGGGSSVAIEADPDTFRWLLHYVKHESLPDSFWEEEDIQSLHTLAVVLGMDGLVQYLRARRESFGRLPKRSREKHLLTWQPGSDSRRLSWQNRKAQSKLKLDALKASFCGCGNARKRAASYEELLHPSDSVMS